jgi:hypothetical protein
MPFNAIFFNAVIIIAEIDLDFIQAVYISGVSLKNQTDIK